MWWVIINVGGDFQMSVVIYKYKCRFINAYGYYKFTEWFINVGGDLKMYQDRGVYKYLQQYTYTIVW